MVHTVILIKLHDAISFAKSIRKLQIKSCMCSLYHKVCLCLVYFHVRVYLVEQISFECK